MDFRTLLQSMHNISEATKEVPGGRVHTAEPGGYGRKDDEDDEGNKVKPASTEKRGKGRPKKATATSGEDKKYDFSAFGVKAGKDVKLPKYDKKKTTKHSIKEYIEQLESAMNEEGITVKPMPGASQIIGADGKPLGTADAATANTIKQASDKGTLNLGSGDEQMNEKWDSKMDTPASEKGKYAGKSKSELLKAYNHLKSTGPHKEGSKPYSNMKELAFAIRAKGKFGKVQDEEKVNELSPSTIQSAAAKRDAQQPDQMSQATQRKDPMVHATNRINMNNRPGQMEEDFGATAAIAGGAALGTALGAVKGRYGDMKQREQGHTAYTPDEYKDKPRTTIQRLRAAAGIPSKNDPNVKTNEGLPGKQEKLDVAEPKGKLDAKDFAALRARKSVKESLSFSEMMQEAGTDVNDMMAELQQDIDTFNKTGHCSDKLEAFLKIHGHAKKKIADESIVDRVGFDTPPPIDKNPMTQDPIRTPAFARKQQSQGMPITSPGEDKPFGFMKQISAPSKTFESKDMKDVQLESWEKELNSLLNEGITVTSSQGQQGTPDSVSINATDSDAQELLSIVRQAGLGVFGGGDEQAHSGYGAPMHGDEGGHGTEPQMSPTVVGDGDDMMALIKKMSGIQDVGKQPGTLEPAGEEGNDYESEEGHGHDEECDSCGSADCQCDEVDEGYEETDEGNEFSGNRADAIKNHQDSFEVDGKQYPVKEENMDHEHGHEHEGGSTCNECGMYEARCVCEPGKEQVEEEYANEAGHEEMAHLKNLLGQGNDLHRQKHTQAVGNPTQVTFETRLLKDTSNLLVDWQKLSGIK